MVFSRFFYAPVGKIRRKAKKQLAAPPKGWFLKEFKYQTRPKTINHHPLGGLVVVDLARPLAKQQQTP